MHLKSIWINTCATFGQPVWSAPASVEGMLHVAEYKPLRYGKSQLLCLWTSFHLTFLIHPELWIVSVRDIRHLWLSLQFVIFSVFLAGLELRRVPNINLWTYLHTILEGPVDQSRVRFACIPPHSAIRYRWMRSVI